MLRSQDMSLVMLYLNRDIAKQGIQHIGQNPSIHFLNLNRHLKLDQLPFNKEIRFLEKLLVRIKFLEGECKKSENHTETKIKSKDLEQDINKHYNRLTYLREIRRDTLEKIKTLREDMFVVEELESYIANNMPEGCENYKVNLDHVCFVISKDKKVMLESVLNYNLRRNACVYNNDKTIEVIENEKFYNISGYVIFTHGLNAVEKIDLLITSLGGRVISEKSISIGSIGLNDKINQVSRIFENNEGAIDSELQLITGKIEYWKYCVNKEMQIYITMNGLGFGKDSDNLVGQGFVLREDLKKIKSLCDYITKKYGYAHVDVLKHYSYKARIPDNDLFDTEEGKPNELESYRDFAYEMRESDSDIEVCVKSIREDESPVRIESKILSADREHSYKKNKDDKNEVHTKRDVSHLYSNGMRKRQKEDETERNYANENVENNNLNEECIDSEKKTNDCLENDHKQIIENVNKYASEELDDSDQSGENKNLLNNSFYNGKSNSTPSIVAVDENKIQKLELPDFVVEKPETPPTYFYTNKLTQAFQDLNDVYGVPAYKEINPALFYIITFPFMFGVMFGDAGHGIMLLCISLYLIKYEKTLKIPEFAEQIFSGRYIMLFCSLWSIFFGFLYSDFLSLSIPLFPSEFTRLGSDYEKDSSYTYPFGIDHTWHHKQNAPLFFNSLKMKMSIVLGFAHMLLGSILSLLNSRYKRDKVTMYCVVVPQTVAFVSFVGYLIFLIFFKWVSTENRQGLISVLVSMFTTPFTLENPMYPYQKEVQLFLCSNIIISFIWMLFSKPVCETMRIKRKRKAKGAMLVRDKDNDEGDELIEIWMHGVIETIEFGIGLVSNTSSYLRLWAISLAHAELTNVLHTMTIGSPGIILKVIMFPVWAFFTVALLIGLEGLSSCLHALRLNWIEFNSKFYKGTGYPFRPLDFKANYEE